MGLVGDDVVELDGKAELTRLFGLTPPLEIAHQRGFFRLERCLQHLLRFGDDADRRGLGGGVPPSAEILSARIWAWPSSSGISAAKKLRSSCRYGPCPMLA